MVGQGQRTTGIDLVVGTDDRSALGPLRRDRLDALEDGVGPLIEIGLLLAREVVIEAVDDEDRDQQEGQGHDREEGAGQPTLECPWDEPAQATRKAGSAFRRCRQRSANA